MEVIKKIASILPNKYKLKIIVLFFMTLVLTLLEILSISSIPILITSVLSKNTSFLNLNILNNFINSLDIKVICTFVAILFIIKNLYVLFFNYFTYSLNYKINITLSKKIFKNYLYSDYLSLTKINTSDMIRNLTTEVGGFVSCINNSITVFKDTILLISILILIIYVLDFRFFVIFSIFLFVTLTFYLLLKNFLKKIGEQTVILRSKYLETITDSFRLIKEIIINAKRNFFIDKYFKNLKLTEKNNLKSFFIFSSGRAVFEVIAVIMMILIILFLYTENYETNFIISYLSLIGISVLRSMPLFNSILTSLNKLQYKKPSIDVVVNLIEYTKKKQEEYKDEEDFDNTSKNLIFFNKEIAIKNLSFSYGENKVLDNINLVINKGEKIALVGSSGSGKTTLINILSGLIKLNNKSLFVDEIPITNQNYKGLRQLVSLMPQESYLMNETILNNILLGEDNNNTKIEELLDIVNINKFLNKLQKKENELVRRDGSNISGGEKQRILFARSIYKNFEFLILDEPTSSLDKENSCEIINKIFKKFSSKTIIIVTHKIVSEINFDKIITLNNGKITN